MTSKYEFEIKGIFLGFTQKGAFFVQTGFE